MNNISNFASEHPFRDLEWLNHILLLLHCNIINLDELAALHRLIHLILPSFQRCETAVTIMIVYYKQVEQLEKLLVGASNLLRKM